MITRNKHGRVMDNTSLNIYIKCKAYTTHYGSWLDKFLALQIVSWHLTWVFIENATSQNWQWCLRSFRWTIRICWRMLPRDFVSLRHKAQRYESLFIVMMCCSIVSDDSSMCGEPRIDCKRTTSKYFSKILFFVAKWV